MSIKTVWQGICTLIRALVCKEKKQAEISPVPFAPVTSAEMRPAKGWFYRPDLNQFLAFVNLYGSCSMTRFDGQTGKPIGRVEVVKGNDWQKAFLEEHKDAKRSFVPYQPALVRARKDGIPKAVLAHLQSSCIGFIGDSSAADKHPEVPC